MALEEAVVAAGYNGCAFANANAEASPNGVESTALRTFRDWLSEPLTSLATEAGCDEPATVADQLDVHPEAVRIAKQLARMALDSAPRS